MQLLLLAVVLFVIAAVVWCCCSCIKIYKRLLFLPKIKDFECCAGAFSFFF